MITDQEVIGRPLDRVDGRLKVTGAATYSADVPINNVAHAVLITSTIGSGRIRAMDIQEAMHVPGVLAILTPFNAPRIARGRVEDQGKASQSNSNSKPGQSRPEDQSGQKSGEQQGRPPDRKIHLLQETDVFFNGQPIGVAVADTLERALHAASLVRVEYEQKRPITQMDLRRAYKPVSIGGQPAGPDTQQGDKERNRQASARIDQSYSTPVQTHNPIEPHATIAVWETPDRLTLYDATQGVFTARKRVAGLFEIPVENVRIVSKFVGGGFGSKGPVWSHVVLAAMAARQAGRPVKLAMTRHQMFGPIGFRGETRQRLRLSAEREGKLALIQHDGVAQTSLFDEFIEPVAMATRILYASPAILTTHRGVRMNSGTPSFMRAPGEASGVYALECAMDELAYKAGVDPVEFRLMNYAEKDPESGKPWSSKSLRECYRLGAERFGWSKRSLQPGSQKNGNVLVGYGMATATYPTRRSPSSARARLMVDGTVLVQSGTQDIGTGTYTIMTQIAADVLGLPPEKVHFELGDTLLPETPVSGGSQTAASTGSAVFEAAQALRLRLIQMASTDPMSSLYGATPDSLETANGRLFLKSDTTKGEDYTTLLARKGMKEVEANANSKPGSEKEQYSMHSFGAQFAEVHVDPDLGEIRVARYTGVFGAGRILNEKTARNQFIGGIVWGISMALMEHTLVDQRWGRVMNADLAEYHVPVNADVPEIDVVFLDESDMHVNPIGAKGIGEIGIVGAPAAIANAVYHATGKRVRDLPITLDKLL